MKRVSLSLGFLVAAVSLLAVFPWCLTSNAAPLLQDTNLVAIPRLGVPDASHYPKNPDSLPGKGPAQMWADFPRIWAERHADWSASRAGDHGAIVFLGDSITQGWVHLKDDLPTLKVANRGIGGDTTRGVLYRLNPDVLSLEPSAIVLLIGTNDIGLGGDPADVADNIREILAEIRKFNAKTPVILCKVMPSSESKQRPAAKIKKLNSLMEDLAKARPEVSICDTWSIYADEAGNCRAAEFPDRLHPNAAGYAKWAAALQALLANPSLGIAKPR